MKKKTRITLWIISILIGVPTLIMTIYWIVMYEPSLKGWESGNKTETKQILIASSGSEFKKKLIKKIITQLKPEKVYIEVSDLSVLKKVNPQKYKAIAILNSCEMYKMDSNVRAFLKKQKNFKKIILLTTSGNSKWATKKFAIDTISGASKKRYLPGMVKKVVFRIKQLLKQQTKAKKL